ncbi:MAG: hypothetical protein A2381_13385 [Bdellovibrionales bacterium RIFOXYB1_FULL_37_110]|nr:MAG: hypothetical protein A2181_02710 [Bdellovibrionales bacterium RIFOXYA1_FULL_38_20]OFZ51695.1 MAG: hypothetical protein A2417_13045 [Bdellovibrionales bacterium RIFOXYC1_FULL_37_79]OFZ60522.1 MAG: hypothetical protein A2381_13385 [Bdellovibrionales bacterium RIFOXYB1_FULL_37_110]OFZ65096.1 MAG: hypothetical protein A2577_09650 [Bdellovibrionales bacterium RIFOXYD1_FULL_36_51]
MKVLIALLVLAASSLAIANEGCMDLRSTFFAPCQVGEEREFVQGACADYEAESSYCSVVEGTPKCIDLSKTLLVPCTDFTVRVYVEGKCKMPFVEHTYCAIR